MTQKESGRRQAAGFKLEKGKQNILRKQQKHCWLMLQELHIGKLDLMKCPGVEKLWITQSTTQVIEVVSIISRFPVLLAVNHKLLEATTILELCKNFRVHPL